jgi:hypothetical protein
MFEWISEGNLVAARKSLTSSTEGEFIATVPAANIDKYVRSTLIELGLLDARYFSKQERRRVSCTSVSCVMNRLYTI